MNEALKACVNLFKLFSIRYFFHGFWILFLLSILVMNLFKRYKKWSRIVKLMNKIPGPPSHFLLGQAKLVLDLDHIKFPYGTYVLIYQLLVSTLPIYCKEKICQMWLGFRPFVLLFTPDEVEVVLNSNNLINKAPEYNFLKPWLGEGLVTSKGAKWKSHRKILTPAFHFKILQDFIPIINENATVLVKKLNRLAQNEIEISSIATLCTLDVICETAMGIKVNCQENESEYAKCIRGLAELVLFRVSRPWFWFDWIFYFSRHGREFNSRIKTMKKFTNDVINKRIQKWIVNNQINSNQNQNNINNLSDNDKNNKNQDLVTFENIYRKNNKRLAFLDLLLDEHLNNKNLSLKDVRDEVETFMFAGHDTTAMGISWALYMLGLYEDVQKKVREEIDEIVKSGEEEEFEQNGNLIKLNMFTLANTKEMKYLDCVLKETQRIYPTTPFIARELSEDTCINNYLVPKGTTCVIFTYLLHRYEKSFPNAEVFNPDRFLPINSVKRHPFAYIPFSAGPRNCIGQKFAQMEEKIIIANVIRNFIIESLDERDKLIIAGEMILRSRNGIRLKLKPRFVKKQIY